MTGREMAPQVAVPGAVYDDPVLLEETWRSPSGLWGVLTTVNHKYVARRFVATTMMFFLLAGVLALLMRWQLRRPENTFIGPDLYNQLFTMHGTTMMFLFAVPIMQAMGLYLVPLMIGTRNIALPRLNSFGYWIFLLGGLFLFDPSGGVQVSPYAIVPVAAFMALFFGFVVAKALAMRHLPPAQGPEAVVGREGVVLAGGLDPEGVVRVAAEEWKATSASGFIPEGSTIRVTKLDGLVLTVEPLDPERAPTGGALPARGGNT